MMKKFGINLNTNHFKIVTVSFPQLLVFIFAFVVSLSFIAPPVATGKAFRKGTTLYTACNLWKEKGQIWAINFKSIKGTLIPAGTRVNLVQVKRKVITFKTLDNTRHTIYIRFKYHPRMKPMDLAGLIFTDQPFETLTRNLTPNEIAAIRKGTDQAGMSKEAVLICYGYPAEHRTPNIEKNIWYYWKNRRKSFTVKFDSSGRSMPSKAEMRKMAADKKMPPPKQYQAPLIAASAVYQPPPVISGRKNWAVIVGVSEYQYTGKGGLTNLVFADDDARAVYKMLRDNGWSNSNLKMLINRDATHRNIMIALDSWLTKAGPRDMIILFWSGHGFPDPEDPEKVYFACYDTDISIPATGYRMDKVCMSLAERNAANVIVMADTCHAGKLITRGKKGISMVKNIEKMKRRKSIPKGWIFMVGADSDRQAIEHSSWSNGAFTHCLLDAFKGKADGFESMGVQDGVITMNELRAYMNSAMPNLTQKVLGVAKRPIITTSSGDPDIWKLTLKVK